MIQDLLNLGQDILNDLNRETPTAIKDQLQQRDQLLRGLAWDRLSQAELMEIQEQNRLINETALRTHDNMLKAICKKAAHPKSKQGVYGRFHDTRY